MRLSSEYPVLVELQPFGLGDAADGDVVRFGTREVHQRRAVALIRDHAQVYLQSDLEQDAAARGSVRDHLLDLLIRDEAVHHRVPRCSGHHDVEVADRLALAAETAGQRNLIYARHLAQGDGQRFGVRGDDCVLEAA